MHGTRDEEGSKDKEELAEEDVEELAVDKYGKRLDKEAQEKAFSVRPSDSDRRRGGGGHPQVEERYESARKGDSCKLTRRIGALE
jgi:hypothetical protein